MSNTDEKIFITTWCGGMGCDNCKLCLIFSGRAELIDSDEKSLTLTYRLRNDYGPKNKLVSVQGGQESE